MNTSVRAAWVCCLGFPFALSNAFAQGVQPYPSAITDRVVRQETPMAPPPANTVFTDPDFGSQMVRATDEASDPVYLRSASVGDTNEWSADSTKFYVIGSGGQDLAYGFNPKTMAISSLPGANKGPALLLPLRPGPMFSYVDSDLMYGTTNAQPFTLNEYRFSTNALTPLVDTTTCGLEPPLDVTNPNVQSDDDISLSFDDTRIGISEGGSAAGVEPFVVVYDKTLGCRWYNTQTGQIGGQWGQIGYANASGFLIDHARLSGSGKYVRISTYGSSEYYWDLATLNVTPCPLHTSMQCGGYGGLGRNSWIDGGVTIDEMNVVIRPLDNLSDLTQLVLPVLQPYSFDEDLHFTWVYGVADDKRPICASVYSYPSYDGDMEISRAWDAELVCIETDGLASTVWRFAHHRAYPLSDYFNTQPLGNVSSDGSFFLFTSTWDYQLGYDADGTPRSDMWIVKLN